MRRSIFLAAALAISVGTAQAESVIRYGISLADIPLTAGQPDRGAGAYQFTGYTIYDPLVAWEMNVADRPGKLVPGLATSWVVDEADKTRWRFTLRPGVKFHDGSAFDADAVIWNLDKVLKDDAPHFDKRQAAQVRPRLPSVKSYAKLDAMTVEITTKEVDSFFPYQMLWFLVSSPTQYEKVGRDWDKFAYQPSGTGPFRLTRLVPRELAELTKNAEYWDKSRLAKVDKLLLVPLPEALQRSNALLAGQVDLIEAPAPDTLPRLKERGMRIVQNVTPHVWNYHLSTIEGSPWTDIRLRKALNLAIDRQGIADHLLNGLAQPAKGQVDSASPWFGKPSFELRFDLDEAKRLVAEAGYSPAKPLKTTFAIAQGGTGQMQSIPMNEAIQQNLRDIGIEVDFRIVELETLYNYWRQGAKNPALTGVTANNVAYVTSDPLYAIVRFFHSGQINPVGVNWGYYKNEKVDAWIDEAKRSFDVAKQDELLAKAHAQVVDDAVLVWVVHDTNPHALSPKVKSFIQAQHWFQDLTTIGLD
ncbi:ABC transporter substrate-binding protein [Enterovirga rhinocerotis]|uniref:Peptide/nickel transport system substrate-binding protein n=1 Tax=Enterovirga rhinocerotis TaxID=1339210 RepID=A0A4R7C507_9HYPH|nr:ABC transporter substrate-binding protein [Enterovirga rhinocerotis]TDR93614.1 peptide/nickel transport system substrate-binding protein [Enterovirga rhinocerotis]